MDIFTIIAEQASFLACVLAAILFARGDNPLLALVFSGFVAAQVFGIRYDQRGVEDLLRAIGG